MGYVISLHKYRGNYELKYEKKKKKKGMVDWEEDRKKEVVIGEAGVKGAI